MVILARELADVQREPCLLGQGLQEVRHHLCRELTNRGRGKLQCDCCMRATAQIENYLNKRLVEGDGSVGHPGDASAIAERVVERLAHSETNVFNGVMGVDREVADGFDAQVEAAMARELIEHVIEHADPGIDIGLPGALKAKGNIDLGLFGLAVNGALAHRVSLVAAPRSLQGDSKGAITQALSASVSEAEDRKSVV